MIVRKSSPSTGATIRNVDGVNGEFRVTRASGIYKLGENARKGKRMLIKRRRRGSGRKKSTSESRRDPRVLEEPRSVLRERDRERGGRRRRGEG